MSERVHLGIRLNEQKFLVCFVSLSSAGVYPPGALFFDSGLYDRLKAHGVTIDVVSAPDPLEN